MHARDFFSSEPQYADESEERKKIKDPKMK
jgi:hypothetical protein